MKIFAHKMKIFALIYIINLSIVSRAKLKKFNSKNSLKKSLKNAEQEFPVSFKESQVLYSIAI